MHTTGFIGGGNMARALAGGLVRQGYDIEQIAVADPSDRARQAIAEALPGITTHPNNEMVFNHSDIVVLAIKPQLAPQVATELSEIKARSGANPLIISILAGIQLASFERWLGAEQPVVRTMPNTPALLGCGVTALYAGEDIDQQQRQQAEQILAAVGTTVWVDKESHLDIVTAVSGSGPAYFFLLMKHLQCAGVDLGLSPAVAGKLARLTALGAGQMVCDDNAPELSELIRRVTSPGGTTERALEVLLGAGFDDIIEKAVKAARDRSCELAEAYS